MEWLVGIFIASLMLAVYLKAGAKCPECGDNLDYNHIGYDSKYGYCHSCGYRGDK